MANIGDLPPPPPPAPSQFTHEETEEVDYMAVLLSNEDPPEFSQIMQPIEVLTRTDTPAEDLDTAVSRRDNTLQEVDQNQQLLEEYLRDGAWDNLLHLFRDMVKYGYGQKAVSDADAFDIYAAHPELVLLLQRQRYVDLRRYGQTAFARIYYRDEIEAHYPPGTSTRSVFVDSTILEGLHLLSRGIFKQVGHDPEERARTRQAVRDYIQLYFPDIRSNVPECPRRCSSIWELGEQIGRSGRCLACHMFFEDLSATRLHQHLEGRGEGNMEGCPAVNDYLRRCLSDILDAEWAASVGPPSPPPDSDYAHNHGEAAPATGADNQSDAARAEGEESEERPHVNESPGNEEDTA